MSGPVTDEEIRAIASMASLALALLAFFTNVRRESLKEYLNEVPAITPGTAATALPDLLLAAFTGGAVLAMAPLCFESFRFSEVGHRAGSISTMFALIWCGFTFLLLFQLVMVGVRLGAGIKARC